MANSLLHELLLTILVSPLARALFLLVLLDIMLEWKRNVTPEPPWFDQTLPNRFSFQHQRIVVSEVELIYPAPT